MASVQNARGIVLLLEFSLCVCIGNSPRQAILNELLGLSRETGNASKYDSSIAPDFELDTPTRVKIQIYIQNIYSVSESSMDFSLDIFLRQSWTDKRLNYENMSTSAWLEMDSKLMGNVWVPDTYFSNEKTASVHSVTVPNKMMHLYRNGTVLYSLRLSLTLSCFMRLEKYPLDEQFCPIAIKSYAYTVDNVIYEWEEPDPIQIMNHVPEAQFYGNVHSTKTCNQDHTENKFACLQAFIRLRRKVGYYIVQVFVPSILIVFLSWVSFWIDPDAVQARVSVGLLTVLTMTTQTSGSKQSLPQVSYIKAIDVWMFTCLLFLFSALVEYSCVNVVARKRRKFNKARATELQPENNEATRKLLDAKTVDKISRFVFPICFLIFNLFFWVFYYCMPSPDVVSGY